MLNLTFGEQVKIILSRKGMTIKQLAELVEAHTGKPMSRQNMTQRLGRDNFQEKDMRLIAEILDCKFQLSILDVSDVEETIAERDITIGELIEEPVSVEEVEQAPVEDVVEAEEEKVVKEDESEERSLLRKGVRGYYGKTNAEEKAPVVVPEPKKEEESGVGEINPYTGKEYKTDSVRKHPKQIGYVQVYDREKHEWVNMTEWAFLANQERKQRLMGKKYEPPTYLD